MSPLFWCLLFALVAISTLVVAVIALMDRGLANNYVPTRRQRRQWRRERADIRSAK